ncbi:putative alpha-amylase family protein [Pseudoxanthomonas spadix BD-a59]|uniref:Alpha-1,4-glucan:maltose-1-phosphate maltosyltransferase n=1 Tax=Pseudoxanthomonas spadix (strain BD-a59) TaxID=1045855 RepID=G7UTA5_PSEUP|nr:alpha-1,4-glucan--maltose-1-phosphate maltosyltransferase [Pseudoxanthomonas spadix]AER57351.1 putative alpha-amylase family protein [Pseudoxanthomonas spadix BD-a59]
MRICRLHQDGAGPLDGLQARCAAAREAGCNYVLIAPPFARDSEDRLLEPPSGSDEQVQRLRQQVQAAQQAGLKLLIDLRLDEIGGASPVAQDNPHWFRARSSAVPDPRMPRATGEVAQARFAYAQEGAALVQWWAGRLLEWAALGVAGFRILQPQQVPAPRWRELIARVHAQAPGTVFAAWTPGVGREGLHGLAGAGFDAAFSSLAWWDGQASWFFDEDAALRSLAQRVVAVVDADEGATAPRPGHWRLAVALGDAWLVGERQLGGVPGGLRQAAPDQAEAGLLRMRPLLREATGLTALAIEPVAGPASLVLINSNADHVVPVPATDLLRLLGDAEALIDEDGQQLLPGAAFESLDPGQVRTYRAVPARHVLTAPRMRVRAASAAAWPRVCIESVSPAVDNGRFPVKRTVGERVCVEADAFCDGHDRIAMAVLWRAADTRDWSSAPMRALGNDRWRAEFPLERIGTYQFRIEAWRDVFATLHEDLEKKRAADTVVPVDVQEALALIERAQARSQGELRERLQALLARIDAHTDPLQRLAVVLEPDTAQVMALADDKPFRSEYPVTFRVESERRAAHFASWYELFPRSQSPDPQRHGTFDDVVGRLPHIRAMGFDVLYMPPIHPIGHRNRKGRNNAVAATEGEPGSPYAIGGPEGGHTTVHPELGGLEAFRRLVRAARDQGLEVALDFAIQCAPDHPWLREHPDWFTWRADGSIPYAENPPKKYQDIVNVDFYASGAVPDLWIALRDVVLFWVAEGVSLFRVDNPHTKPFPFWEWMIAEVRGRRPDVVFLSEAFTRPKMMYRLAKCGFSQSYTYFTWRNHKAELQAYVEELNQGVPRECFRPHFFVNTPDINPPFLQTGGRNGHLIRAALATTLSGLWGMYQGFELCEATALQPGKEEYLDSDKYQLRSWPERAPGDIVDEITRLNQLRRLHPELQSHLGTRFYLAHNDQVLYFGKLLDAGYLARSRSMVLVAINLDPHAPQEADVEIPLWELGLPDHAAVAAEDLWDGHSFHWHGKFQRIRLEAARPFAIWRIRAGDQA